LKILYKILLVILLLIFFKQIHTLVSNKEMFIPPTSFHSTLYLDYKFNEQEIKAITEAAKDWETATHNKVKFKIVTLPTDKTVDLRKGIMVLKVDTLDPEIIYLDIAAGKPTILGLCKSIGMVPYIKLVSPRLNSNNYQNVVKHELGHLIGLGHTDNPNTLMFPTIDFGSSEITETDLYHFCKKYDCR
jgi:predicted Zn-dependent protease